MAVLCNARLQYRNNYTISSTSASEVLQLPPLLFLLLYLHSLFAQVDGDTHAQDILHLLLVLPMYSMDRNRFGIIAFCAINILFCLSQNKDILEILRQRLFYSYTCKFSEIFIFKCILSDMLQWIYTKV